MVFLAFDISLCVSKIPSDKLMGKPQQRLVLQSSQTRPSSIAIVVSQDIYGSQR